MESESLMEELLRTNDPVLISLVEAVLGGEGIRVHVADQHMSIMEGSVGVLPRRILVLKEDVARARELVLSHGVAADLLTAKAGNGDLDA